MRHDARDAGRIAKHPLQYPHLMHAPAARLSPLVPERHELTQPPSCFRRFGPFADDNLIRAQSHNPPRPGNLLIEGVSQGSISGSDESVRTRARAVCSWLAGQSQTRHFGVRTCKASGGPTVIYCTRASGGPECAPDACRPPESAWPRSLSPAAAKASPEVDRALPSPTAPGGPCTPAPETRPRLLPKPQPPSGHRLNEDIPVGTDPERGWHE